MPKLEAAIAGALSLLLLASCGKAPAEAENAGSTAEGNAAVDTEPVPEPVQPGAALGSADEPVPPPDAVSHPNGYLPPAPSEPEPEPASTNSAGTDSSPPATEDQYIRNGQ